MANIRISNICGLCAGCKRSIDTAKQLAARNKVVLYKEIVHNQNVNSMLQGLGINTILDLKDAKKNEHVVLRAHGEPPQTYEFLKENNIDYSDCTCPNVTKIHNLVREYSLNDYTIILIGKYGKTNGKTHPEVFGTIGWCLNTPVLIEDTEDAINFTPTKNNKYYLVCQTTFNENKADSFINIIAKSCKEYGSELIINKSICSAQKSINSASIDLAKSCDVMIVVGGKNSSNSIELFNNIKSKLNAIFIDNIKNWKNELFEQNIPFDPNTRFGITAGASTMKEELFELKNLIEEELKKV